jgi:hypothetical protein
MMQLQKRMWMLLTIAALLLVSGVVSAGPSTGVSSVPATELDGAPAAEWMQLMYMLVQDRTVNPPNAARLYAYAGITLYQSVWQGIPNNYSMAGIVGGMPELPYAEEGEVYDWTSVANAAMETVVPKLFDAPTEENLAAVEELYESQKAARTAEMGEDIVDLSDAYGKDVGAALLEWIAKDNYTETRGLEYEIPSDTESMWELTTEGTKPNEPYWGQIRTFGLPYAEYCDVALNMEYSTDEDSAFYAQAKEVMDVGTRLTPEQQEIARFWVDVPGQTGAPAGHWVMIMVQLVDQMELPLGRAAEMFGLTGVAMGDAFISGWSLKYRLNLLRPVTYIQRNLRRSWQPYIQTPPFPEYPSGHSLVSGAASEVLTGMFGVVAFTDRTHIITGHEPLVRSFTSFEAAATEAAISRLYGGIHYRVGIENGVRQGRCIGQYVLDYVRLRAIPQGGE